MGIRDRLVSWLPRVSVSWGPRAPRAARPALAARVAADPLADLPLRREWATQAVRDARAEAAVVAEESMLNIGGTVLDMDDQGFRRLSSGSKFRTRDLTPIQQDRMLQVAWYLFEANPFAKRLIGLMTDLVVGEGYTVSAKDEAINDIIQRTWTHPINRFDLRVRELYQAFSLNGELVLPAARNPITGLPHIGYIDPLQVERVEKRLDNVLVDDVVVLKPQQGESTGARLKVIQEDPISGLLVGDVFYARTNTLPNSGRGRSDLLTLADWLDLYDSLMFGEVERVKLLSAFVYDLTIEGASNDDEIRKKVNELAGLAPGSVYGHNQKTKLEAINPDLKATDRSEIGRMLAIHIAGSIGFPISWLGFPDSNRATIEGQNDVMLKTPAARQKEFAAHLGTILRYAVEGATTTNRALYRDVRDVAWQVNVPEIASKDVARVGGILGGVVSGLDVGMQNGTMSRRAAAAVTLSIVKHLGVNLELEEVLAEADQELAERQAAADDRAADIARMRAAAELTTDRRTASGRADADEEEEALVGAAT